MSFEETFGLFADCEQEARVIMQPDLMQEVHAFFKEYPELDMSFVFKEDCMSVVVIDQNPVKDLPPQRFHQAADQFFCKIWFLLNISVSLAGKGLAAAWQEQEYLSQRRSQESAADKAVIAASLRLPRQQKEALNPQYAEELPPIMQAILIGELESFRTQLGYPQLDVNQCFSQNGNGLLHLAALNGRIEMLKLLLARSQINKDVRNNANQSPFDLAKERGQNEAAQLLLRG